MSLLQRFSPVLILLAASMAFAETPVEEFVPVVDKTLVAWVAPSNLTQRGGGVLTLEDAGDRFDAVVFGEIAAGKWMAGSDTFARTNQDQAAWPVETAAPGTLVQVAVVYHGREVTIYRDGARYAEYAMAPDPHEFGQRCVVVMGKRHRHAGEPAFFAGEIDDARIYDTALSAEQLAALKANDSAGPKPWAWWTFDGNADERMGRFLDTSLTGGAMVKNGRLVLNGRDGMLLAKSGKHFPFTPETPARPTSPPADWLTYHLTHPGPGAAMPGDPNCAFYWKGKYHLHYIYNNKDGFSFAHVSSTDMLHWKWHPTTLTPPNTDHGMFSGTGFFTKDGRPAIIYHGEGSGRNQIAIAEDDELERWTKPMALEPIVQPGQDGTKIANWDPDAWLDGDTYYALSGGSPGSGKPPTLFRSPDLKHWDYLGLFLSKDMPDVQPDEDVSCPNFFKIGNKHMLLCISHNKGCRYYLGDWKNEQFTPDFHARMNWKKQDGQNWGGDFFAPESLLAADGRRVMWAWCILNTTSKQSGIQSLPRELSLPDDGVLRIKPLRELESLRKDEQHESDIMVEKGAPYTLQRIAGDTLEINVTIAPNTATRFGIEVYCNDKGAGGFPIVVDREKQTLSLGPTAAPFTLANDEPLNLRVYLDKDMAEVFANDRQAIVGVHAHGADELRVRLITEGAPITVPTVTAWKMKGIWEEQ